MTSPQAQAKAQGALDLQNAADVQLPDDDGDAAGHPGADCLGQRAAQHGLDAAVRHGQGVSTRPSVRHQWWLEAAHPAGSQQTPTYSLPNLQEIGRQGAAAALANISPTAQMHAQTPGPPGQPPVPGMPSPRTCSIAPRTATSAVVHLLLVALRLVPHQVPTTTRTTFSGTSRPTQPASLVGWSDQVG